MLSASLERACCLVNYWYSELMVASCISQSAKDSCGFECHFVAFSLWRGVVSGLFVKANLGIPRKIGYFVANKF